MIIIVPLDGKPIEHFEDYNNLFERIIAIENIKPIAKHPNFKQMSWSFAIHPSQCELIQNYTR